MDMLSPQFVFFLGVALVVILSALGMLLSRNTVYSVLYLVMNFAAVAVLYMMLGASFIALAQVTVYAGAIMVLFLFVVMLLGAEALPGNETIRGQRVLAGAAFIALVVEAVLIIILRGGSFNPLPPATGDFSTPTNIGMALFTRYSLPFELTSVILLVAVVGAIVLTKRDTPDSSHGTTLVKPESVTDALRKE
jgi:NADH-quinone oxidoreductase subunit J